MSYINSDDIYAKKSFFSIVQIFTDYPEIEWIGGIPNHLDELGRSVWVGDKPKWNKFKYLRKEFKYIQQEGVFWHKNLWEKTGSYISTQHMLASDLELWVRFFECAEFYIFPSILGSFRLRCSNQKSLDLLFEYNLEANSILSNMPITTKELKQIHNSRTKLYKLLNKLDYEKLWRLFGYFFTKNKIEKYPNEIYFDRTIKKFILKK